MKNKYAVGDIVGVQFPFSNFKKQKMRPALVIATPENRNEVILAKVTSALKGGKYRRKILDRNIVEGILPKISEVDIAHLYTIQKSMLCGKWCVLSSARKSEIIMAIGKCIGNED